MSKDLSQLSVLILNSNKYVTKTIVDALKDINIRKYHQAYNHQEAMKMMRDILPDILIVGWNVGDINAIELTKYIRTDENSPSTYLPIILIHGFTNIKELNDARDVGVNECVMMPFTVKALKAKILSIVTHPRKFLELPSYIGPDRRRRNNPSYEGPERRNAKGGLSENQVLELLGQQSA